MYEARAKSVGEHTWFVNVRVSSPGPMLTVSGGPFVSALPGGLGGDEMWSGTSKFVRRPALSTSRVVRPEELSRRQELRY
jgi:hypothetical protein